MSTQEKIINKVAESGLVNFDISDLRPQGRRIGLDLKEFLYEGLILTEKDFREQVENMDLPNYEGGLYICIALRMLLCHYGLIF